MDSRLERAEQLIEEGRYDEAEDILRDMTDPHAYQLARKAAALKPEPEPRPLHTMPKMPSWMTRRLVLFALAAGTLVAIGAYELIVVTRGALVWFCMAMVLLFFFPMWKMVGWFTKKNPHQDERLRQRFW